MLMPEPTHIIYPDSDGERMAENTLQFQWIVTIKENLDARRPDFVGGDLLWYPVEGDPKTRQAPDVLVAIGRPKGHRGSYMQWHEDGVAPQVVFEILSPGNRPSESIRKFKFYQKFGVEELYVYDPDRNLLDGWLREDDVLREVDGMSGFVSPRLGIRFEREATLQVFHPDGSPFLSFGDLVSRLDQERARADEERARADEERARADEERARADALARKLEELGFTPD